MPSDCQCSTHTETKTVTKVIGSKTAARKIDRLEGEVDLLKAENSRLKLRLRRADVNKAALVRKLKSQLDKI